VVQHFPRESKALSSNPSTGRKRKSKEKKIPYKTFDVLITEGRIAVLHLSSIAILAKLRTK
jgi:hypothetical protein